MATKLYFHDATNDLSGTFPSGEQSSSVPDATASGATTLRKMDTNIGAGQATSSLSSAAQTSAQNGFQRFFCSKPLNGDQTIGSSNFTINMAGGESNGQANFNRLGINIYIWRPSTGALVGTIFDSLDFSATEPGSENVVTHKSLSPSASVNALDGDVIIVEIFSATSGQGMSTSYTISIFYDGTTENTTEGASVSNHASFIEFAENISFQGGPAAPTVKSMGLLGVG